MRRSTSRWFVFGGVQVGFVTGLGGKGTLLLGVQVIAESFERILVNLIGVGVVRCSSHEEKVNVVVGTRRYQVFDITGIGVLSDGKTQDDSGHQRAAPRSSSAPCASAPR